ncbi:MAG: hypothetical protein K9N34_09020 [Candidatus Marinimicrobia bacterium]|nr:hypothetical protein [Candidatus Neomarinimicrobiota bacterium]
MFQQVVISSDLFKFLSESGYSRADFYKDRKFRSEAAKLLSNLIEEECWVVDGRCFLKEYYEIMENASPSAKAALRDIITYLPTNKLRQVIPDSPGKSDIQIPGLDKETIGLIKIALTHSRDKLVLKTQLDGFDKVESQYVDLIGCDIPRYNNPAPDAPLIRERRIELFPNKIFSVDRFFKPIIATATLIEIYEPFLFTKNQGGRYPHLLVLKSLLRHAKKDLKIVAITRAVEDVEISSLVEKLRQYIPGNIVDIPIVKTRDSRGIHDRTIRTDNVDVDIGKGLGFVRWDRKVRAFRCAAGENGYIHVTRRE